jgi:hypothetical protein
MRRTLEQRDGVGIQTGAPLGNHKARDARPDAGDLQAAVEVDADAGHGFGGGDVVRRITPGLPDHGGVGKKLHENRPAPFPAILLQKHFVGSLNRP